MSSVTLALGISAALFMSVFAVMAMVLILVLAPPYGYILAAMALACAGLIVGRRVYDELATHNKKERV